MALANDAILRARVGLIMVAARSIAGGAPTKPPGTAARVIGNAVGVPFPVHAATLDRLGCLMAAAGRLTRLALPSGC